MLLTQFYASTNGGIELNHLLFACHLGMELIVSNVFQLKHTVLFLPLAAWQEYRALYTGFPTCLAALENI